MPMTQEKWEEGFQRDKANLVRMYQKHRADWPRETRNAAYLNALKQFAKWKEPIFSDPEWVMEFMEMIFLRLYSQTKSRSKRKCLRTICKNVMLSSQSPAGPAAAETASQMMETEVFAREDAISQRRRLTLDVDSL